MQPSGIARKAGRPGRWLGSAGVRVRAPAVQAAAAEVAGVGLAASGEDRSLQPVSIRRCNAGQLCVCTNGMLLMPGGELRSAAESVVC
eukprot:366496-Chlamydomonas_euryale.AAC.36